MVDDDDSSGEFREVNPGNWKKNNNNKTPIPTYTPTTPWPTYSPTSLEDLAEWLKRKQKYVKNRDKVPDDVWEADEASVSKKKQLWLEKQKDKKNNKEVGQNTEKHQAGTPTITPTYYDPPLVPTREQKRAKQAAKHQNRTQANEAADDNLSPSSAPTLLSISNNTDASPTISDVDSAAQLPTRKQKQADKRAELAAQKKLGNTTTIETQEPTTSPTKSPTMIGREYDESLSFPKTREPPKSREKDVIEEEENVQEVKGIANETKSSLKEDTLEEHSNSAMAESGRESVGSRSPPKSRNPPKSRSPSEETKVENESVMVSLKFPVDESHAAREAPKPSPKPVEPRSSVKVNFTFINNRAKRKQPSTDAPTPSEVVTSEPTYLMFPTIVPTEQHPTYAPTVEWTSKDRSSDRATLYDKRTCPDNHLFFESEFKEFQGAAAEKDDDTVFFTYGIQTGTDTDIEDAVEKIQLWLLDDVASKLLHCSKTSTVMRNNNPRWNGQDGVLSSVYYSKDDYQYAKQCNPTYPDATMCAIVSSTMRFEAADHDMNARPKVLSVIYNQLQSGYFMRLEEENILGLAYLGPELGYFQDDIEVNDTPTFNWSSPTSVYAAIGVASFTVFALLLCLAMRYKLKKERRRRIQPVASSSYRDPPTQYRNSIHDDFYSYTSSDSRRSYYRQNI